jgi:DNA integrity scanning protein DisA with diadenylate cyclase activity
LASTPPPYGLDTSLVSNGIRIDAEVSKALIEAIFRKDSPIHDGAVLI